MIELFFPFDSVEDKNGLQDREYHSNDFRVYFGQFLGNGVYPNPSNGLKIDTHNKMYVKVNTGSAFINGAGYVLSEDNTDEKMLIEIGEAHMSHNRKDIICVQLNETTRDIKIVYKMGKASTNPQVPNIERNADIYELQLAEIFVKSGIKAITQAEIMDTRLDNTVCGLVTGVIESVDTTELFNQYDAFLKRKLIEWEATQVSQTNEFNTQMLNQQIQFDEQHNTQQNDFNDQMSNQQAQFEEQHTAQENEHTLHNTEFNEQMQSQKAQFVTQHTEIDDWYNDIKLNITRFKTFDFDNISELKGAVRLTEFKGNNIILESITNGVTSKKLATRNTTFLSDGNVEVDYIVFGEDGDTPLIQTKIRVEYLSNGDVLEEVMR